jgi:hypothetical protein
MSADEARSNLYLALVIREAERELIAWTCEHRKLALRVFPDDRALGSADRQLASDILVISRNGENGKPAVLLAFVIARPFALERGANLPAGYPRLVTRDNYWTANVHELADSPAWSALLQDVESRSGELAEVTPAGNPPVVWAAAALRREKRLSRDL